MSNQSNKAVRSRLHTTTLDLLRRQLEDTKSRTDALERIASKTQLTYHWLEHFARGTDTSPTVDKVEKLYEHLSGEKLFVA